MLWSITYLQDFKTFICELKTFGRKMELLKDTECDTTLIADYSWYNCNKQSRNSKLFT